MNAGQFYTLIGILIGISTILGGVLKSAMKGARGWTQIESAVRELNTAITETTRRVGLIEQRMYNALQDSRRRR